MRDTTTAAEDIRLAAIRRMDPVERLRQALALSEWVRALALTRLRELHPGHTERELVERVLGAGLVPLAPRPPGP